MSYHRTMVCFLALCHIIVGNAIHAVNATAKPQHNAAGFLDLSEAEGSYMEEESLEGIAAIMLKKPRTFFGIFSGALIGGCCACLCIFLAINSMGTKMKDHNNKSDAMQSVNAMVDRALTELPENLQQHFKSPEFEEFCDQGLKDHYNKFVIPSVKTVFGKTVAEDPFLVETVTWSHHDDVRFETIQDVRSIYKYCEITLYKKEKRMISLNIDQ
eukprot:gnl/MRDRNA2_/MRDRNA2_89320_c0_seq1.p1 gnl/MRDRNA2_/MRDRNA2_89320_c0~~gnl/MRDRNA2_/MRDRNA2_89320_c0_seq1.p1  ORF type:complete len:214 (+),score=38.43 gnl/MRDRNA2_/MRDRNA2_89320_c0_seq1:121-762(+)